MMGFTCIFGRVAREGGWVLTVSCRVGRISVCSLLGMFAFRGIDFYLCAADARLEEFRRAAECLDRSVRYAGLAARVAPPVTT